MKKDQELLFIEMDHNGSKRAYVNTAEDYIKYTSDDYNGGVEWTVANHHGDFYKHLIKSNGAEHDFLNWDYYKTPVDDLNQIFDCGDQALILTIGHETTIKKIEDEGEGLEETIDCLARDFDGRYCKFYKIEDYKNAIEENDTYNELILKAIN